METQIKKPNGGSTRSVHSGQVAVRPEATPVAAQAESIFNAKSVIQVLEGLMVKVTAEECTASTVNAACNAAARITDLLRLHLEAERLKRKG